MRIKLDTDYYLQVDTLEPINKAKIIGLFNEILKRTKSYTKTKIILRNEYGLFINIVR